MRSLAIVLVTLAMTVTLSAWPRSAAALESSCRTEFDGCPTRLDPTKTPISALKCVDGFRACARECASVDICRTGCRGQADVAARRATARRIAAWLGLDRPLHALSSSARRARR
jgi:hypothetical protein